MPETLDQIREDLGDCQRCKLCETRDKIVFGSGDPNADWLLLGEAPGRTENLQGLPFVGRSGKFLEERLKECGWGRENVYITNCAKCWPPKNRNPEEDEVEACSPFLWRQIKSIQPKVITTLGKPAANLLLGGVKTLVSVRGRVFNYGGIPVIPTYHPSYVLRGNTKALGLVRQDLGEALKILFTNNVFPPKEILADWPFEALVEWAKQGRRYEDYYKERMRL